MLRTTVFALAALATLATPASVGVAGRDDKKDEKKDEKKEFFEGDGTAYSGTGEKDATGFNSCQFGTLSDRWEEFYAALPSSTFDREAHCGRCIEVRGTEADAPDSAIRVMIVDECATCDAGDVDMSISALEAATGYAWDRKRIEWSWASCDDDGENEDGENETAKTIDGWID